MDALHEAAVWTQNIVATHSPGLLDRVELDNDGLLVAEMRDGATVIGPAVVVVREAIEGHLCSTGELLRMDQITPDRNELRRPAALLARAREVNPTVDTACVLADVESETWFAAAAESLTKYLDLPAGFTTSESPEDARHGKAWVKRHFRGTKDSETQDQPGMTAVMDLALCRRRSPSFDKLCRELEQRLRRQDPRG
jgi:hypothetical protein